MERSETRRRWLTLVAVGLGGLLLGCCGGVGSLSVWDRLTPGRMTGAGAPARAQTAHGRVTGAHFDAIKPHAQYGEVVRIVGFEGTEYARNLVREGAVRTSGFIWTNPDGSNLTCEFDNDSGWLFHKSHYGLNSVSPSPPVKY